jgi:hypothetical protein
LDDTTELTVALGGDDGAGSVSVSSEAGVETSTSWRGPDTTQANFHALLWQVTDDLPTSYLGYDTGLVALRETERTEIGVDLAATTDVRSGVIAGNVTSSGTADRENWMFARFPDGASIQLVEDYDGPDAFSYVAPALPEASIVMAASEGSTAFGEAFGLAYRMGLTPGGDTTTLVVPRPSTLLLPATGSEGIGAETEFRWEGEAKTFILRIEDDDYYQGVSVVTSRKQVELSTFAGGAFELRSGGLHVWTVHTHGDQESVDELATEGGFMDPFSYDYSNPRGTHTGTGEFTVSAARSFWVGEAPAETAED